MKLYFLFAVIDLITLLIYPIAYIFHQIQKRTKSGHKNNLNQAY